MVLLAAALVCDFSPFRFASAPFMSVSPQSSTVICSHRLSFVQQRRWFMEQLQSPSGVSNAAVGVRIYGALDCQQLVAHLNTAVAAQAIFRSRYVLGGDDAPEAQVLAESGFQLREEDFSQQYVQSNADKLLERRLQQEQQVKFDLAQPPLLTGVLLKLAENEHLLVLVAHPIVADPHSLGRFVAAWLKRFVVQIDQGKDAGGVDEARTRDYGHYADWQQQQWRDSAWVTALREVSDTLHGAHRALELPWDHRRATAPARTVYSLALPVSPNVLARLAGTGERHGLRLDAMLCGLYALLLARLSSQTGFCLGMPVNSCPQEWQDVGCGPFENLLPLRAQLAFDETLLQWLLDMQAHLDFMLARRMLPIEKVQEALAAPAAGGQLPWLRVAFACQQQPSSYPVCNSLRFEPICLRSERSLFDLQLTVLTGDKPHFVWQFNRDLLEKGTIEQWHRYLLTLLESASTGMEASAGSVALLDRAQQQQLLKQLSGGDIKIAREQSLYGRIALLARQVPRHTAIIQGERFVRYQSLVQQAEGWAAALRDLGVKRGARVVMPMPRSAEAFVALLAVWRAGGCAVPVPQRYSEEQARTLLLQVQPVVVLFHAGSPVSEHMKCWRGAASGVCEFTSLMGLANDGRLREEPAPAQDGFAVMLTKGSTDPRHVPVFIPITHGALLALFHSLTQRMQLRANAQWLAMAEFYQDISLVEALMPLLSGACLVVAEPNDLETVDQWAVLIQQRSVTCMIAPPERFHELLQHHALPAESYLFSRNHSLKPDWLQEFLHAGATVVNLFGTPESGIINALQIVRDLRGGVMEEGVSLGAPLQNTHLRILDEQMAQVMPGGIGDLLVGGDVVSPGYWQRDELVRERFVQVGGDCYFRTGFRARLASDGQVFLVEATREEIEPPQALPHPSLEQAVLRCWQFMLERDEIDPEQPFAELGGSSLVALRLVAHVNRYFGATLPLAMLLQAATVRAQAWCLQGAGVSVEPLSLQTLHAGSAGSMPWVLLFDEYGSVASWKAQYAQILATKDSHSAAGVHGQHGSVYDQVLMSTPVFALHCNRYEGAKSLAELGGECIAALPEGRFVLAGAGFGGALAAAIAMQIPERISRLELLDAPPKWDEPLAAEAKSEHEEQLALFHRQLWRDGVCGVFAMPVRAWLPAQGLLALGAASGWELSAKSLDVVRVEGGRDSLLSRWFAQMYEESAAAREWTAGENAGQGEVEQGLESANGPELAASRTSLPQDAQGSQTSEKPQTPQTSQIPQIQETGAYA
ncbi:probable non-ribosomal peptide synthetase protein [gamma proteobacterium HdN1]|nr:probable non-ribosomal peptide synthetase protein [gamma proteobacterium HdN1]